MLLQSFVHADNIFCYQACIENAGLLAGRRGKELIECIVNEVSDQEIRRNSKEHVIVKHIKNFGIHQSNT